MPKRVLLFEHPYTCSKLYSSGSYWFRLEMAFGLKRMGWEPFLVQLPTYEDFPWVNQFKISESDNNKEINNELEEFDLIILLHDFESAVNNHPRDPVIVYWDIEALPRSKTILDEIQTEFCKNGENSVIGKPRDLQNEFETFYYHFEKATLRYWKPDLNFSIAKYPLLPDTYYLPLGAEPSLYKNRDITDRDIGFAILGTTSRWFQAQNRITIASKTLKQLEYPLTYWYGALPEQDQRKLPKNCYAVGTLDFSSFRYVLQRCSHLLHIPRPYHLLSQGISVTLFQALAAGSIPFHMYKNGQKEIPGFPIAEFSKIYKNKIPTYPEEWTYQTRFTQMLSILHDEGLM